MTPREFKEWANKRLLHLASKIRNEEEEKEMKGLMGRIIVSGIKRREGK